MRAPSIDLAGSSSKPKSFEPVVSDVCTVPESIELFDIGSGPFCGSSGGSSASTIDGFGLAPNGPRGSMPSSRLCILLGWLTNRRITLELLPPRELVGLVLAFEIWGVSGDCVDAVSYQSLMPTTFEQELALRLIFRRISRCLRAGARPRWHVYYSRSVSCLSWRGKAFTTPWRVPFVADVHGIVETVISAR